MLTPRLLLVGAILSLFAFPSSALAQTGQVLGTVIDASTGDPLPGANVLVEGTSIGAAADVDGEFIIRSVPAGSQTLVASYIGYERQVQPVEVVAGEDVRVEIEMPWEGVQGEEVVITSQARGQMQAINEQLAARTITNVVSEERIRELPDESAAAAVSRLPGVSLQNGDQIVVRGIEAKYNTVAVNGVQLPSTTTNRATGLGFISSNMLSGIEVSKTVTPAMDANTIGGNVNLRLKEAPEELHYDAMLQGDYNTQDHTADNYRAWASVSNRFFGDQLGVFLQGNARRFNGGGDLAQAPVGNTPNEGSWRPLNQAEPIAGLQPRALYQYRLQDQVNISEEYGASLLLDYRLPNNGKIVLQNAYSTEDFDETSYNDLLLLTTGNREFEVDRTVGSRYLLVNSLQGEHLFGSLGIDWTLAHSRSRRKDDLGYLVQFAGQNYFEGQPLQNWTSADQVFDIEIRETCAPDAPSTEDCASPGAVIEGETRYEDFGERRLAGAFNLTLPVTAGFISGEFQGGGKYTTLDRDRDYLAYYRRLADGDTQNQGAAEWLESIGANPSAALPLRLFQDPDYADERGDYYLEGRRPFSGALNVDYLDEYFRLAQTGWPTPAFAQSNRFDYVAEEEVAAGYLMGDFNIGRYLNLLGGVRYENFSFNNSAPLVNQTLFDGSGAVTDTLSVEQSRGHWFPNIQAQIMPTDWFDIRLAYTKTTSRPDYEYLLASTWVGDSGDGAAGNPLLRPTIADNFDAYVSFHSNRIGLLTFGVFAKNLTDVVRQVEIRRNTLDNFDGVFWAADTSAATMGITGYEVCENDAGEEGVYLSCENGLATGPRIPDIGGTGLIDTYVNNPDDGFISGFEIDWQTNLWYLPRPFNSIVFNVNYTRLNSEMDYQSIFLQRADPDNPFSPLIQVDTVRTGRLFQQADDVVNVALGADIGGFSGRVSFRYQGDVLSTLNQRNPALDAFVQPRYSWDFSLRQQLPIEGLSVFFNGVNITHPSQDDSASIVVGPDATGVSEARTQIAYYPRRFQLGIRYGI
jgi:TonB-dependent receptor